MAPSSHTFSQGGIRSRDWFSDTLGNKDKLLCLLKSHILKKASSEFFSHYILHKNTGFICESTSGDKLEPHIQSLTVDLKLNWLQPVYTESGCQSVLDHTQLFCPPLFYFSLSSLCL